MVLVKREPAKRRFSLARTDREGEALLSNGAEAERKVTLMKEMSLVATMWR